MWTRGDILSFSNVDDDAVSVVFSFLIISGLRPCVPAPLAWFITSAGAGRLGAVGVPS